MGPSPVGRTWTFLTRTDDVMRRATCRQEKHIVSFICQGMDACPLRVSGAGQLTYIRRSGEEE